MPGRFQRIRHVRPKYACKACDVITQAPAPAIPTPLLHNASGHDFILNFFDVSQLTVCPTRPVHHRGLATVGSAMRRSGRLAHTASTTSRGWVQPLAQSSRDPVQYHPGGEVMKSSVGCPLCRASPGCRFPRPFPTEAVARSVGGTCVSAAALRSLPPAVHTEPP